MDRRFSEEWKRARPSDRKGLRRDGLLPCRRSRANLPVRHAGLQTLEHPALCLETLEQTPRAYAKRIRQRFKTPGTGGGIGDPCEVRLMDENQLRVAGDAPREFIGQAERQSERQ